MKRRNFLKGAIATSAIVAVPALAISNKPKLVSETGLSGKAIFARHNYSSTDSELTEYDVKVFGEELAKHYSKNSMFHGLSPLRRGAYKGIKLVVER